MCQHGADAGQVDFRKRHALHMAAASGQVSTLTLLLDHVNATSPDAPVATAAAAVAPLDESAFSPLHFAAYRGHVDCVQRLLALSAYRTLAKSNAYTPLHCAVQNGHADCLSLLLNHFGEDYITTWDANDRTVIHVAALCNQASCLSVIVQHCLEGQATGRGGGGVSLATLLGQPDRLGRTGLMVAAGSGSADCFLRLLQLHRQLLLAQCRDADGDVSSRLSLAAQDQQGRSILHHCACGLSSRHSKEELATHCSTALLVVQSLASNELSCLIGLRDSAGRTPLHVATVAGLPRVVELLLAAGADIYAVDNEGCIPALSSAPTHSVAACLSLIMAAMFPPLRRRLSPALGGSSPALDEGHGRWPTCATAEPQHRTHFVGRRNSFPGAWRPSRLPVAPRLHSAPVQCTADARETVQVLTKTHGDSQPLPNEADFY